MLSVLTYIYIYIQNICSEFTAFMEILDGGLEGPHLGTPGDFDAHLGNDSETRKGLFDRNGQSNLNLSGVQLLGYFTDHSLYIQSLHS